MILTLGAKINYIFCQWNSSLLKMGVIYSAIKIFYHITSNTLELKENETLFKSAKRKYSLTHRFYPVEEFLAHNNDIN